MYWISVICRFGREFRLPVGTHLEDYDAFYIGGESLCLTNLLMSYNKCQVCYILSCLATSRMHPYLMCHTACLSFFKQTDKNMES